MNKTLIAIITSIVAFSTVVFAADNILVEPEVHTQKPKKVQTEIKEVNFHVHLHCANCVEKVKAHIAFEKGVKDLNVTTHSIAIKYDASKTSEATLKAAIEKLGYKILEGEEHNDHPHN